MNLPCVYDLLIVVPDIVRQAASFPKNSLDGLACPLCRCEFHTSRSLRGEVLSGVQCDGGHVFCAIIADRNTADRFTKIYFAWDECFVLT
jgi:hypothetical protein